MNQENQSTMCAENIWKLLTRATVDNKHPWRVCTFCTAGISGPDSRNVILRSVDVLQCELIFYTDVRSQKVLDLSHNHAVALLFWNPKSREQLRMKAVAEVVHEGELWERHWAKVPDHARRDYSTIEAPGTVLLGGPEAMEGDGGSDQRDINLALAKENFRVIRVVAHKMDYLRLDRSGHERKGFVWEAPAGWQAQRLLP